MTAPARCTAKIRYKTPFWPRPNGSLVAGDRYAFHGSGWAGESAVHSLHDSSCVGKREMMAPLGRSLKQRARQSRRTRWGSSESSTIRTRESAPMARARRRAVWRQEEGCSHESLCKRKTVSYDALAARRLRSRARTVISRATLTRGAANFYRRFGHCAGRLEFELTSAGINAAARAVRRKISGC
jgi:hypothetical protein